MKSNEIVKVENLTCVFDKKTETEVVALDNFSYNFEENKIHYIIGNSGSGKSTLVLHFNCLLKSKIGNIIVDDFLISENKRKVRKIKELRKKISLVFQYPEYQLFKDTIKKDILFGPMSLKINKDAFIEENTKKFFNQNCKMLLEKYSINNLNEFKEKTTKIKFKNDICEFVINNKKESFKFNVISEEEILNKIASHYLNKMGLDDSYLERSPFGLSGGQKRRVAIAGILAINPKVLVFDEPTAGLDPEGIEEMMDIIRNEKENGKTIFVITHSMDEVLECGDNVILMDKGKVIAAGEPYDIFKNKDIYKITKIFPPKVIETILKLEEKNKKFSKLWDMKPRTCEELADCINKLISKRNKNG